MSKHLPTLRGQTVDVADDAPTWDIIPPGGAPGPRRNYERYADKKFRVVRWYQQRFLLIAAGVTVGAAVLACLAIGYAMGVVGTTGSDTETVQRLTGLVEDVTRELAQVRADEAERIDRENAAAEKRHHEMIELIKLGIGVGAFVIALFVVVAFFKTTGLLLMLVLGLLAVGIHFDVIEVK